MLNLNVSARTLLCSNLILSSLLLSSVVLGQVDVIESQPGSTQATKVVTNTSGELFYQLQLLQDEMMQLRGAIEEQQHQVQQLKQQRLDDYLSLDKRISELFDSTSVVTASGNPTAGSPSEAASAEQLANEDSVYKKAYALVRAQKYDEAINAFDSFLLSYPAGKYVPNAHYWLGELHLLAEKLELARQSFSQLLEHFPTDRKVPDATFKLGKVYFLQGDTAKAKALLDDVVTKYSGGSSSAVKLAKDFLEKNF